MTQQNIENLMNLALDATESERDRSLNLDVGYNPIENEWELIIKYSGSLDIVRAFALRVTELRNEYAVIAVRERDIPRLSQIPQIEFIEKPKRLYFQVENGRRVSCINAVQDARFLVRSAPEMPGSGLAGTSGGLFGQGTVAVFGFGN